MNSILSSFTAKKKADNRYLSLEDGETVTVLRLVSMEVASKAGFDGNMKEVLRLTLDVQTPSGKKTKVFDNGTARFADELVKKGVDIGKAFTITRNGESQKTRYVIGNVQDAKSNDYPEASGILPASSPENPFNSVEDENPEA